jgi:hypothetical protein
MALLKSAQQISCSNCNAANPWGSPYCARCGAQLGELHGPSALAPAPIIEAASRFSSPVLQEETPHFQDSFLSEGQDPMLAKSTFERAAGIMISGEAIEYVATANKAMGHTPDCVVATNKRIMLYKKRAFGKLELDDMFWRDLEGVQMKEGRNGVLLIFDSIQGWQIVAENLPKSQAWRLNEIALKNGERLAAKAEEAQPQQQTQAPAASAPVAVPAVPAAHGAAQAPASAPVAATAPRQFIYADPAAAVQPAQAAAFHASPPAQAEVVVLDTQTTQPVLRTPAEASPASTPAPRPVPAQPAATRPASGPLTPQAKPATAAAPRPAAPATAPGVPAQPSAVQATTPLKTTSPLQPGAGQNQPKMGSGPLSSRLAQAPAPAPQRNLTTSPISAPLSEAQVSHDDLVRKMKQLKELLEADLITREEYDSKKAEILARL